MVMLRLSVDEVSWLFDLNAPLSNHLGDWKRCILILLNRFSCLHLRHWPMANSMTMCDWLMSCQSWLPLANYGQWAKCKHWRPAVYLLYKMTCLNGVYRNYCQINSAGNSIWHKTSVFFLDTIGKVISWEAGLLSPNHNMRVYKEQTRSQSMGLLPDTQNCGCACAGNVFPVTAGKRSRHASRHVRHARAVMHAGIAN